MRIDLDADRAEIGTDADLRLEYRGVPFTGEAVRFVGERLSAQTFYVNGVAHGPDREWWADGRPMSDGLLERGRPVGVWRRWYHNGRLAVERHFDAEGDLDEVRSWDENGAPIEP